MNKDILNNLNWKQGMSRLYDAVWATNLAYWCLMAIGRSFREWVGMLLLAGVLPLFLKKLIKWVHSGFTQ